MKRQIFAPINYMFLTCSFMTLVIFLASSFAKEPTKVLVTIEAQKFYIKTISGIDPLVLIPKGYDPHSFEPKPAQLGKISEAQLYLTIGLPEEKEWVNKLKAVNPKLKIVDTSPEGGKHREKQVKGHSHGDHHHLDPHTWLVPSLGEEIARKTYEALRELYPERSGELERGLRTCLETIRNFSMELKEILSPCAKKTFLVYHPAFGPFAEEFGLTQIAIEKEGKEPKAKDLARIQEEVKGHKINKMIIQPGIGASKQKALAERLGLVPVEIDPISQDWMSEIKKLAKAICE